MKNNLRAAGGAIFLCAFLCVTPSCSTMESWFPSSKGWSPGSGKTVKGSVSAGSIGVDTVSLWESLEREIARILPLLLLEKGYVPPDGSGGADYTADVFVIEREYMEGWQTKRSLSVEVKIRGSEKTALPAAAGRAMLSGGKTLASSKITTRLLRIALSKALSELEKNRN